MNLNATIIGQTIAFAFFVWFCMKYVWPLLLGMIEEREKRIADGLAAAEEGQKKLEKAEERGKQQASKIVDQAQKRRDEIVESAKDDAKKEGERIKEAAMSEIEQEKELARQALQAQVAELAVAGAEQILLREVDKEAHNDVLQKISAGL